MLRGERLWDYVSAAGEEHRICALCKSQAESAGWLPRELAAAPTGAGERPSRARALRERLGNLAESARAHTAEEPDAGDAVPRRRRRLLVEREPASGHGRQTPSRRAGGLTPVGGSDPEPAADDPDGLARRVADRFNASEAGRTVAGLTRSLGEPNASIEVASRAGDAKVTVAWELSWYQWEIDPGEHGAVREVRKGTELEELSEAEREWNARVAEDGTLRPAAV